MLKLQGTRIARVNYAVSIYAKKSKYAPKDYF